MVEHLRWILAVGVAALFAGCGGNVGGGEASGPDPVGPTVSDAGTPGSPPADPTSNPGSDGGRPNSRDGSAPPTDAGGSVPVSPPVQPPPAEYNCAREVEVTGGGSIDDALAGAGPGTCINVRTGTYRGGFSMPSGADGSPVVLRAADGPLTAVIDASGLGRPAVTMIGRHMIVDGFDIVGMPTGGGNQTVVIRGGDGDVGRGVVLRNSRITGGHNHLKINQMPVGVVVEGNEFFGNYSHIPISITGAEGLLLARNHFHGWDNGGDSAIQIKGGSLDVRVEGNVFENVSGAAAVLALGGGCGASCDNDPDHYGARRVVATNNLFLNVGRAFEGYACLDCAVVHNTVVNPGTVAKLGSAASGGVTRTTANMTIMNNAFVHTSGGMLTVIQINDTAAEGLRMEHNAYYNGGSAVPFGDAPATSTRVEGDPQFEPESYVPSASSPLLDAAETVPFDVGADHQGNPRGARPDIGAFEAPVR